MTRVNTNHRSGKFQLTSNLGELGKMVTNREGTHTHTIASTICCVVKCCHSCLISDQIFSIRPFELVSFLFQGTRWRCSSFTERYGLLWNGHFSLFKSSCLLTTSTIYYDCDCLATTVQLSSVKIRNRSRFSRVFRDSSANRAVFIFIFKQLILLLSTRKLQRKLSKTVRCQIHQKWTQ